MAGGTNKEGARLYRRVNGEYVRNAPYKNPEREEARQQEIKRRQDLANLYGRAVRAGIYNIWKTNGELYQDVIGDLFTMAGIPRKKQTFENIEKNITTVKEKLDIDINPSSDRLPTAREIKEIEDEFNKLIFGR